MYALLIFERSLCDRQELFHKKFGEEEATDSQADAEIARQSQTKQRNLKTKILHILMVRASEPNYTAPRGVCECMSEQC